MAEGSLNEGRLAERRLAEGTWQGRERRIVIAGATLIALAIVIGAAFHWRLVVADARRDAERVAMAICAAFDQFLDGKAAVLAVIAGELEPLWTSAGASRDLDARLRRAATNAGFSTLALVDRDGAAIAATDAGATRPAPGGGASDQPSPGAPIAVAVAAPGTLRVSRPILAPDGAHRASLVAEIPRAAAVDAKHIRAGYSVTIRMVDGSALTGGEPSPDASALLASIRSPSYGFLVTVSAARVGPTVPWHARPDVIAGVAAAFLLLIGVATTALERFLAQRRSDARALLESRNQMRTVFDGVSTFITLVAPDGNVREANRLLLDATGMRRRDVVGKPVWEMPCIAHSAAVVEQVREMARAAAAGRDLRADVTVRTREGGMLTVDATVEPIRGADGGVLAIVGSGTDVTQRRLMEQQLRRERDLATRLVETAPMIILVIDPDGRLRQANRHFETLTGTPREQVVGKDFFRCYIPEDRVAECRARLARVLAGTPTRGEIGPLVTKTAGQRAIEWHADALLGGDGRPSGVLVVGKDVTEQLRGESRLRQAQRMEAIGQLTGGIAHDFNNVLGIITGALELLARRIEPGSAPAGILDRAIGAAQRGAGLTHRLLAFSRRQVLQPQVININTLVEDMTRLIQAAMGEQYRLETRLAADLWPTRVDPGQLEGALLNLAINSRDAMPGSGLLAIRTANATIAAAPGALVEDVTAGDYVCIEVRDTGRGMTEDVRSRAFEPFFTTKDVGQGTGLGLSMIYGFVTQTGGHVRIDSVPGRGTSVCLYLPRYAGDTVAPAVREENAPRRGAGQRILVVEDDDDLRAITLATVAELGYTPVPAVDVRDAMEVLRGDPGLGAVFTDVVLPGGLSGYDLAVQARRLRPALPILVTSGYPDAAAGSDTRAADLKVDVLLKPVMAAQIGGWLQRNVGGA